MKMRYVFTVTREFVSDGSIAEAKDEFQGVKDEAGEYLYGGNGSDEQITVMLQIEDNDGGWHTIDYKNNA